MAERLPARSTISLLAWDLAERYPSALSSGTVIVVAPLEIGCTFVAVHAEFDWRTSCDVNFRRQLQEQDPVFAVRLAEKEFAGRRPLAVDHRTLPTIHVDRGNRAVVWCADPTRLPEIAAAYGLRSVPLFSSLTYFLEDQT